MLTLDLTVLAIIAADINILMTFCTSNLNVHTDSPLGIPVFDYSIYFTYIPHHYYKNLSKKYRPHRGLGPIFLVKFFESQVISSSFN